MGNSPYCCSYSPKDPNAKDYGNPNIGGKFGDRPADSAFMQYKNASEVAKKHEAQLIKLQAVMRGYLQRKVNKLAN